MGLIWGAEYFEYVRLWRSVWYSGFYGQGKTSLAVYTALELARRKGYRIISNIPLWPERAGYDVRVITDPDPSDFRSAVLLIDEAADVFDAYQFRSRLIRYIKYLRHRDLILLLPSVDEVHKRLRKLCVQRVLNLEAFIGLPVWVYRWWRGPSLVSPAKRGITGLFAWWVDEEVLNVYNSAHAGVGLSTDRILSSLAESLAQTHAALVEEDLLAPGIAEGEWGED